MSTKDLEKKTGRMSQADMPRATLKDCILLAEALRDNFAGRNASGIDLAQALNRSPQSSSWRLLTGAALAYGLTDAAYHSSSISLTNLGRQIVSPTTEGADKEGLIVAAQRPGIPKSFYEKYNGAKIPKQDIAKNVLEALGLPPDRSDEALKIIIENADLIGAITRVGDGQFLQMRRGVQGNISASVTPDVTPPSMNDPKPEGEGERDNTPGQQNRNDDGVPVIYLVEGMFGIAASNEVQKNAWINVELRTEFQTLMDQARKVSDIIKQSLEE